MKITNRVFYVGVKDMSVHDVPAYMDAVKKSFSMDDSKQIKLLRDMGQWEDLFIPVRNTLETKVELLTVEI